MLKLLIFFAICLYFPFLIIKAKGKVGEKSVALVLGRLPRDKYYILNDIMIKNDNNTTSQIDHIVVSQYGIFVIETKNYKGWIFGTENSDEWTEQIYREKFKFRNPVKQNYGHVIALKKLLGLQGVFVPLVVFTNRATLKGGTKKSAIYISQLRNEILRYNDIVLSEQQVKHIVNEIQSNTINDRNQRIQHVKDIRDNIRNKEDSINLGICPSCRGNLVMRKGKYGYFYGCSNYPKCKFLKNID